MPRSERLALAALLLVGLALRLGDFAEPWTTRGWQQMDAFNALQARNWIEHGFRALSFAPALDAVPPSDGRWQFYMHHPPGAPLLVALSFATFGVSEWAARLPAVALSLLELLATWGLARRMFGARTALATAMLAACLPVTAFYGSLVDGIGPMLMGFHVLSCWLYLRWLDGPSPARLAGLLAALLATEVVNWQGSELAGLLALHALGCGRRRGALALLAAAFAVPLAQFAHLRAVPSAEMAAQEGASLLQAFLWRSWGGLQAAGGAAEGLRRLAGHVLRLHGAPVLLLAAAGALRWRRAARPWLLAGLAAVALADMLVFLEGAARHEYWVTLPAPVLLLLAGAGAARLADLLARGLRLAPPAALSVLLVLPVAADGAWRTASRFEAIEDTTDRDFGLLIRAHTPPGGMALTCAGAPPAVLWYARRRVLGGCDDALTAAIRGPAPAAPGFVFFAAERPLIPHGHGRTLAYLRGHYAERVEALPDGTDVFVFDLGQRR